MKMVTTETISGQNITETKKIVFSEQVLSVNVVKDAISGIKGIFGGKSNSYSEEYAKGRQLAIDELQKEAEKIGANAIVGANVHYNQFVNSDIMLIIVTANGTAVYVQ
ncbi:YbjQ family protein [Leuconostoc gelidum subsp. aenigmaticum]|uniref:YbjQ family protein n=1 Tax=Leuconostoc gelidum TaxID=1244 RepID=UPI001CC561FA|nr:YbjQ family protein [Leuconostoc gelidum]MBZ6008208.1 YbjQ family protein [Leuconostoc gelidum subsp. aenigmaticum]